MDVQMEALGKCVHLASVSIMVDVQTSAQLAAACCVNIASAMCQVRDGKDDEATALIFSTKNETEDAIRSARLAIETVRNGSPLVEALGIDDADTAIAEVSMCVDHMVALQVALTAWLDATAPEHKKRLNPALHTYTETCITHFHPQGDGKCCCCEQPHEAHWHYQTLAEAQAGYDEIPEAERGDFDTYLEQLASNDLINPAALESAK